MNEWDNEPDFKKWEYLGLTCYIYRNPNSGTLCGYVEAPEYIDIEGDVHGGITFRGRLKTGEYALGFDCNHDCDIAPRYTELSSCHFSQYRNFNYVIHNCELLAKEIYEFLRS